MSTRGVWLLWTLALLLPAPPASAQGAPEIREVLVLGPCGGGGRRVVAGDPLLARLVAGTWAPPRAGEGLGGAEQGPRWQPVRAREDGLFAHPALRGGYALATVELQEAGVFLLEAEGHSWVSVNGVPRVGDPYRTGWPRLPVALAAGPNELLFRCARGGFRARLRALAPELQLDLGDRTVPDLIRGEDAALWAAVGVLNPAAAPSDTQGELQLWIKGPQGAGLMTPLPRVPPSGRRKVGFRLPGAVAGSGTTQRYRLRLVRFAAEGGAPQVLDEAELELRVRQPQQTHLRTFRSGIDGSVQYYAVRPARPLSPTAPPPALVLSLHGAAVEARRQAEAYASKSWAHIVAPTNRRPYGFDWEDWGRLDALEVLARAQGTLVHDPRRVYLTGHSMGGHGTWHLGATYPDRFAAIAPSAGWISFASYGGRRRSAASPVGDILARAGAGSDTLELITNTARQGIYILHGTADDNVPVAQARQMRKVLETFHRDLSWHEQPKAGHWWNVDDEPGADCVDWAPIFDLFARRSLPAPDAVREVDFVTADPGISDRCAWLRIDAQREVLRPSRVQGRCDPHRRRFRLKTDNVARLALQLEQLPPGQPLEVALDGQEPLSCPWPDSGLLWLAREGEVWAPGPPPGPGLKRAARTGPFQAAFRRRFLLVVGTEGSPAETAWAWGKARYDAETFGYRGNGSVDIVSDAEFDPAIHGGRNLILYGHAQSHGLWESLLGESPVRVARGSVTLGTRRLSGEDLACLFLRPHPRDPDGLVGVIAGSGLPGLRLTERLPIFVSGTGYPDLLLLDGEALRRGPAGVLAAGFFGQDWSLEAGELAWRQDDPR